MGRAGDRLLGSGSSFGSDSRWESVGRAGRKLLAGPPLAAPFSVRCSRALIRERGSSLRLGKLSLDLGALGEGSRLLGGFAEALDPALERGKERGLRRETGEAGLGLRGDPKGLLEVAEVGS